MGLEPITYRLQGGRTASCATTAQAEKTGFEPVWGSPNLFSKQAHSTTLPQLRINLERVTS